MIISDVAKKILSVTDSKNLSKAIVQLWDLKGLSKDLAAGLTEKIIKQKDLVIEVMAKEFSTFLSKINISEEAQKIMDGMSLNVQASINYKDKTLKTKPITMSSKKKTAPKRKIKKTSTVKRKPRSRSRRR